jgi:MFS family permease
MTDYTKENTYLIDENTEISIGESPEWTQKIVRAFPAFTHKNYRYYFFGQFISLTGTWLQIVAQGWLVFEITQSAYMVGVIAAVALIPILIFGLFAGAVVDKYPKKTIILISQTVALICAGVLGILTMWGHITVWQIGILAFLIGITDAFDKPARQAFVIELVGKEDLSSAIALNAGIFNAARVIGPAIAGILIALYGTGWAFLLNAISYIFVLVSLWFINVKEVVHPSHMHPLDAIKDGLSYSFSLPHIKVLLIFTTICAIFGWSYATLLPVIISTTFHMGAAGLGYFYGAAGFGALFATVVMSALSKKVKPLRFITIGNVLFTLSILLFTLTTYVPLALFSLFIAGFGLILQFATVNSMIQHSIADEFRGRVMSIYILMFMGTIPIGSYLMGVLAQNYDAQKAIQLDAIIVFISSIYLFLERKKIHAHYVYHANEQL